MDPRRHCRAGLRRRRHLALLAVAASAWLAAGAGAHETATGVYRQILKLWAGVAHKEAVLSLVTLERRWAGQLNKLKGFQVATLTRLVQRDRLALVGPARLHQLAFEVHATRSYRDLLAHSVTINDRAVKLSLRYGEKSPEVRETAAVLLTSMAVLLRNYRYMEAASHHLTRATKLDPGLTVAFEWGASAEEEQGNLGSAARLLRRLVELQPDNFAGRLRVAMVEAKHGAREATGMLEGIVRSDHRSWVWIFAVQELARDYARSGRENEAIDLLRRASKELPARPGPVAGPRLSRSEPRPVAGDARSPRVARRARVGPRPLRRMAAPGCLRSPPPGSASRVPAPSREGTDLDGRGEAMRPAGVFLLWVVILGGPATAEVTVRLTEPRAGLPVFGKVEVTAKATATGEDVLSVEFFLDGRSVGKLAQPPWRMTVAIEETNQEHRIEVVAQGSEGGEVRDSVLVESIHVDNVVDLELQQLYVTVTRAGRRVFGLGEDDFTVLDRGQRQEIVTLAFGDLPGAVSPLSLHQL